MSMEKHVLWLTTYAVCNVKHIVRTTENGRCNKAHTLWTLVHTTCMEEVSYTPRSRNTQKSPIGPPSQFTCKLVKGSLGRLNGRLELTELTASSASSSRCEEKGRLVMRNRRL